MQKRHPMQRCSSCIVIPSGSLNVALVGQTRTQGGLSQWLHSTKNGISLMCSLIYLLSWPGKARSYAACQIHLISSFLLTDPSAFR